MKIKRFNETEIKVIDSDTANNLIEELKGYMAVLRDRQASTEAMINQLENYQNPSKKSNDQIDDTIAALRDVRKSVEDVTDKLDTAISNMISYSEEGSKYLYTETNPKS